MGSKAVPAFRCKCSHSGEKGLLGSPWGECGAGGVWLHVEVRSIPIGAFCGNAFCIMTEN